MKQLESAVICEIRSPFSVYSRRGRSEEMIGRICYGLSFCEEGKITYTQAGKEYVSDAQHAVLLPKDGSYHIRGDETGVFPVVNFDCTTPLCDTITVFPIHHPKRLIDCFAELEQLVALEENRIKRMRIVYQMLEILLDEAEPGHPILQPALELLETGYMRPNLGNTELAHACGLSEVYFRKLFAQAFGTTPHRYLIGIRLRKAQQLLCEGKRRVSQVAELCGFSNEYHFSRTFKKFTGISPSEYARNQEYRLQG